MTWNLPSALHAELRGDPGPWHRFVKPAWRASITEVKDVSLPKNPSLNLNKAGSEADHAKVISYWAPMFQLLTFGLGWSRPDVGLLRWREQGYPQNDPILRTVHRWWGEGGITDVLAWAQDRNGFGGLAHSVNNASGVSVRESGFPTMPGTEDLERRRQTNEWQSVWGGGGDPHHLLHHAQIAIQIEHPFEPRRFDGNGGSTLLLDNYAGWYQALIDLFKDDERPVDAVVKPIGWLGTFARSPETGVWHRTDEATHLMAVIA